MFRPIKGSENKLFTPNERPETAGETYHLEVLRPLIKVSEYLGSWPRDGSQFILRLNAWNGLTLFVLHFYTVHKFFNWMTVVKTTENIFEVFEQLTLIIRTAIVALCFDYRFLMHQSNMDLFKIFGSITTLNEEWCLLRLKNIIKFVIGACFFFVFLHVLFASIFMFHTSTDKYVNWLFYGDAADQTPDFVVRMIMIADWALYLYLVICNECFFFGLYIALCLTMLFKVKDFNAFAKRIQKERLIKTGSQVQELYQMHTRLFGFMAICMVASEVGEANSEPIISLIKIAEYGDIEDWVFQQETQLLITKINTPMLKLSGWSCFELNMQFMLTILGALATYAIIIIQMA